MQRGSGRRVAPAALVVLGCALAASGAIAAPAQATYRVDYPTTRTPRAVAVGDVTRDGRQDLLTVAGNGTTVAVLAGKPGGGFAAPATTAVGLNPVVVAVADVTGDDIPDVVTANGADGTVSVLAGQHDGTLAAAVAYATGVTPSGRGDRRRHGRRAA